MLDGWSDARLLATAGALRLVGELRQVLANAAGAEQGAADLARQGDPLAATLLRQATEDDRRAIEERLVEPETQRWLSLVYQDLVSLGMARGLYGTPRAEAEAQAHLRLQDAGGRAEDGPLRLGTGDWAGTFLRGDTSFGLLMGGLEAARRWVMGVASVRTPESQGLYAWVTGMLRRLNECNENAKLRAEMAQAVADLDNF